MNPVWLWLLGAGLIGAVAYKQYKGQQPPTAPLPTVYAPPQAPPPPLTAPTGASSTTSSSEKTSDPTDTGDNSGVDFQFPEGDIRKHFASSDFTLGTDLQSLGAGPYASIGAYGGSPAFSGGLSGGSFSGSGGFLTGPFSIPGYNPGGLPVGGISGLSGGTPTSPGAAIAGGIH